MIELRVLGSLDVRRSEGESCSSILAQPKRAAVLAYLAIANPRGLHRRDKLLGLFWPDRDAEHARAALRNALHFLRQSLGHGVVLGHGDEQVGIAKGGIWCDAVEFEDAIERGELDTGLDLYGGHLLEGFFVSGAPEFERWLEVERERLRGRASEAAWGLAEREEHAGNGVEAAVWARRAAALVPDDEGTLRRVIELLERVGDRAGAMREYDAFARRVREEYEVQPAAETQVLIARIKDNREQEPRHRGQLDREPAEHAISANYEMHRRSRWPIKFAEPAPSVRRAQGTVLKAVGRVIMRALATRPGDRSTTAAEFAPTLDRADSEAALPGGAPIRGLRLLFRSPTGIAVVLVLLGVLSASAWLIVGSNRTRWALETVLPEIQRLIDQREIVAAYRLVQRVEPYVATNPEFQRLWLESTLPVTIRTTPAGAQVYITDYRSTTDDWFLIGTSPIAETRVPAGQLRFRVEKAGFHTIEAASVEHFANLTIEFALQPATEHPEMIHVPGGPFQVRSLPPVRLQPYWLDRYEVSNRAFKEFMDGGGYREQAFWTHPIVLGGRVVPWEQAITAFVDRTGRPGPATWELGSYVEGTREFPVGGVSWYEAAAYCQYGGKRLPTLYHWYNAAGFTQFSDILTLSNFRSSVGSPERPAAVGAYRGIGPYGHYDMAGNVREWVLNPVGGRRYILGGGWSDPGNMFYQPDATLPGDRSPQNGFRCARYVEEPASVLGAEVNAVAREYRRNVVNDSVFRLYRDLYLYESMPLNPQVESVDEESPYWRRETIRFDAPYGDNRIIIHLFLPKDGRPPYQAVVHFPPDAMFRLESSRDLHTKWFDFLVRTGRAVVYVVVEGTHERHTARAVFRERVIHWTIDIARAIDYLEMRDDIDASKLAYYGLFGGAARGPIFTAVEPRFRASVLVAGGLFSGESAPEIEPANFAPRATVPVLMVNGRDDFFFPLEISQRPLFRLLGAPQNDKRHAVVEGGTAPNDWQLVVKEILDWLDRYLGPVK